MEHDGANRLRKSASLMRDLLNWKRPTSSTFEQTRTTTFQNSVVCSKIFNVDLKAIQAQWQVISDQSCLYTLKKDKPISSHPIFQTPYKYPSKSLIALRNNCAGYLPNVLNPESANLSNKHISEIEFFLYSFFAPERARTIYQCQSDLLISGQINKPYQNVWEIILELYNQEKKRGIFRFMFGFGTGLRKGNIYGTMELILLNGICYESVNQPMNDQRSTFYKTFIAAHFFLYPLQSLKVRLAVDVQNKYTSALEVLSSTVKKQGLQAFYRGYVVSCVHRLLIFWTIDNFLQRVNKTSERSVWEVIANATAVSAAFYIFYPMETLTKRVNLSGSLKSAWGEGGFMAGRNFFVAGLLTMILTSYGLKTLRDYFNLWAVVIEMTKNEAIELFYTPDGKGWGLRTLEKIADGAFVCKIVGEPLTIRELFEIYNIDTEKHLFPVLPNAFWIFKGGSKDEGALCYDATSYGNINRFINCRCCDANLIAIPGEIKTPDRRYFSLTFFTTREIDAFEELTLDCGTQFGERDNLQKTSRLFCVEKCWKVVDD